MNIKQKLQFKNKDNQYGGFSLFGMWPTYMVLSGTILFLAPFTGMFVAIVVSFVPFILFLLNANFTRSGEMYIKTAVGDSIIENPSLTPMQKDMLIRQHSYFVPDERTGWLFQTVNINLPTIRIKTPKLQLSKKSFKKLRPATTSN